MGSGKNGAGDGKRDSGTRATVPRWLRHLALSGLAGLAASCNPGAGKTAYVGAEVFDGTGAPLILDAVIIVADGHIEAIGPPDLVRVPRGAEEVRLDGRWVIPGLIDAHVHTEPWTLARFLAYGVTTVRDVGGNQEEVMELRDRVALGGTLGPRMYVSGAVIDGAPATREHATEVTTPTQARRAVDQLTLLEASQAKVYTKIDRRLLRPLMDEAHDLALPVTGHLGKVDAVTAARLGVMTLEHMTGVVEATVRDPNRFYGAHNNFFRGWNLVERSWAQLDSASLERTAGRLAELGVRIVPTLALHEAWGRLNDRRFIDGLDLAGVPESVQTAWNVPGLIRRAGLQSADFRAFRRSRTAQDRFVRLYHRAGGLIAAGSDAPNQLLPPGAALHDELALLVRAGLEPRDALLAATRDGARLLGADSIGVLTPGAVADFVILNANPLDDIANTRAVERVVLRGAVHWVDVLKEGW
jgi:imidazolonepropionase-like amidohydrolase